MHRDLSQPSLVTRHPQTADNRRHTANTTSRFKIRFKITTLFLFPPSFLLARSSRNSGDSLIHQRDAIFIFLTIWLGTTTTTTLAMSFGHFSECVYVLLRRGREGKKKKLVVSRMTMTLHNECGEKKSTTTRTRVVPVMIINRREREKGKGERER